MSKEEANAGRRYSGMYGITGELIDLVGLGKYLGAQGSRLPGDHWHAGTPAVYHAFRLAACACTQSSKGVCLVHADVVALA